MLEIGTIEGFVLKVHIKFEVNRLQKTRDFVYQVEKSSFEKTRLKFLIFLKYLVIIIIILRCSR